MARIKVTDDRQGRSFRTGVNGRFYDFQLNQEVEVDDAMVDHLKGLGVAFEEVSASKRASSSEEGSEEGLAPTGPHDVRAPATDAKAVGDRQLAGDQPGDVTESGGVSYGVAGPGPSIEEDAKISDIRVAAERRAPKDASVAELAGEGESDTDATKAPQGVKPTHKDVSDKPKATKRSGKQEAAATPRAKDNNDGAGSAIVS